MQKRQPTLSIKSILEVETVRQRSLKLLLFVTVLFLSLALGSAIPRAKAQCISISHGAGRLFGVNDMCWFFDPGGCGEHEYCQMELCICCNYCSFSGSPYSSGCYNWDGLCIHSFCPCASSFSCALCPE